jgi:hypothetical protein
MSQAFFAIAGAIVGVLGTVLTALVGARHEEQRIWREVRPIRRHPAITNSYGLR